MRSTGELPLGYGLGRIKTKRPVPGRALLPDEAKTRLSSMLAEHFAVARARKFVHHFEATKAKAKVPMVRRGFCTTVLGLTVGPTRELTLGLALRLALGLALGLAPAGPAAASVREGIIAYAHQDYHKAYAILLPLAERGDAEAQTLVGFMFAHGWGVPQNFVAAAAWYRRSSEQGNARAQYLLGLMYDKGHGVPIDAVQAYKWLDLAVAGAQASDRPAWVRVRDAVGSKLSLAELDHAQRLALRWRAGQRHSGRGHGCPQCRAFNGR